MGRRPVRNENMTARERMGYTLYWLWVAAMALCLLVLVGAVVSGCTPRELAAPCDTATLESIRVECKRAVRADCERSDAGVVDQGCATLVACNKRIDQWLACPAAAGGGGR